MQFSVPLKADFHINFNRQVSQQSSGESMQLRCPVYVYNCSLEHLKEQLVHPTSSRQPSDIFFRYVSHLHCTPSDEGRFRLMTIERTDAGRGLHGFRFGQLARLSASSSVHTPERPAWWSSIGLLGIILLIPTSLCQRGFLSCTSTTQQTPNNFSLQQLGPRSPHRGLLGRWSPAE